MMSHSVRRTSLADRESILKSFEPSHYDIVGHTEGTFREGKYISPAEVFLIVKTLKASKAAMKSDLKCSKSCIEEFSGWLVCVKWPGVLEGRREIVNCHPHTQEGIIPIHKKVEKRKERHVGFRRFINAWIIIIIINSISAVASCP